MTFIVAAVAQLIFSLFKQMVEYAFYDNGTTSIGKGLSQLNEHFLPAFSSLEDYTSFSSFKNFQFNFHHVYTKSNSSFQFLMLSNH
jgi:hypothetical protein